jgi:hypothetical protein
MVTTAQTLSWQGQASGWMAGNTAKSVISQIGVRYMPEVLIEQPLSEKFVLAGDMALNTYGVSYVHNWQMTDNEFKLKSYRVWTRFASDQFEIRIGLQKISFGPAKLIRSLMWFDHIDPRDPLQLTDGVYALLTRYYFQNNANIWCWLLYGNDAPKGWEMASTKENRAEYGGRFQVPLLQGELGVTYHHRYADFSNVSQPSLALNDKAVVENRFGLDGRWDMEIGLWFEGAVVHQPSVQPAMKIRQFCTIGADYTVGIGNGLYMVFEHFQVEFAEKVFGNGEGSRFSGTLLNYPLNLLDMLSTIVFYDWKNENWYRTLTWQRSYDAWQLYCVAFWNPATIYLYQNLERETSYTGNGFYIMVVFNH